MEDFNLPIRVEKEGLYCPRGDFHIDAWQPVSTCLVTHAHSDHARIGHDRYFCAKKSLELLHYRLGPQKFFPYQFGEKFKLNEAWVSFHPAGHIFGSAQVRIETKDHVCVISGDYKRAKDATCEPFEVVTCDSFVTESTFALPIYKWQDPEVSAQEIFNWWEENRKKRVASIIFCYALGKAERILSLLAPFTDRPCYLHGAILPLSEIYLKNGISLLPFKPVIDEEIYPGELILAPPSAQNSRWLKRFYPYKTAYASGWMQVRGMRKQKNVDKSFVLSDHADWPDLLKTINETGASTVYTTHGKAFILSQYLNEKNVHAQSLLGTESLEGMED